MLALKQWFHLLRGTQQVHVQTDRESLGYLKICPRPLTPRQARWSQFLEEYNLMLWYVPGLENPAADDHLYVSLRSGRSVGKKPDVDEHAERALQFDTEPAVEPEDLEPLPSNATAVEPEDLEPAPSNEILAEDSHQPEVHLDDAGNEPEMRADTDNLPDVGIDRPPRVTFGKELQCAPTLAELIRCQLHRDGTLQSVPLPKVGTNTPYRSILKGTHRRVHLHYQCKDSTSTAVWAAAYREDPCTRHIYEVVVRSPAARHQLQCQVVLR